MDDNQTIIDALWVDDGDYIVFRNGRIFKRNWHSSGKTMEVKQQYNKGYLTFCYKGKMVQSHRIIANLFISNPHNLPYVDHINTIPDDNNVTNLRFVTPSGNNLNPITRRKNSLSKSVRIYQYTKNGEFVKEWTSAMDVERQTGLYRANIGRCCRGEAKSAYGFIWKYERNSPSGTPSRTP